MAEDSAQEKTEEATPRRLEKAREEGQVPRSKELTTTAVLLGGTMGIVVFGALLAEKLNRSYVLIFNWIEKFYLTTNKC
jgi:Flagellar biosynthesis pathway, component FlhB